MTSLMEPFDAFVHHRHHDQPAPTGPNPVITTEEHVTTPAPRTKIRAIADIACDLAANQLIAGLAEQNVGVDLTQQETSAVIALARSLEDAKRPVVAEH